MDFEELITDAVKSIPQEFLEKLENVRNTVIHEIAHHLGMSEDEIRSASD